MSCAAGMPLFGFLFETPLAALGTLAAAAAVPLLIYLINRRRFQTVDWAAMRFLLAAQRKNRRRMRVEQWLLLAVRTLLLVLLVVAMFSVMPWAEAYWRRTLPQGAAVPILTQRRTHRVLVLDGSYSMALKVQGTSCFERARKKAQQVLDEAASGDGFSIVLMAAPPRQVVAEPSDDTRKVAAELAELRLPHGNGDLAATLLSVDDLLRRSPAKYEDREVFFLTDLQRATWAARPTVDVTPVLQRIQTRARTILVDVGQDGISNSAVTQLALGVPFTTTGTETPLTAVLQHFGAQPRKQVRVELLLGPARATARDKPFTLRSHQQILVDLKPGSNPIAFAHKFSTPGDYAVQVRVEGDALHLDDTRSAVVTVKDTLPVLLVNGKPAVELYERASEWLGDALNPFRKGLVPRTVPARPKTIRASDFADAGLGDLNPYDCVFLCDVRTVSKSEAERLEAHLRRGGGVVFCLGPNVADNLEVWNRVLYRQGEGILPARLLSRQVAPERHFFRMHADERGWAHPLLSAFGGEADRVGLTSTRFAQYVRAELPPKGQARAVLSFVPDALADAARVPLPVNDPAVIEATRFRGRVVVLTSAVNMDWSAWPLSPSFPAMMQELLHFAVGGRLRERSVAVGDVLEEHLAAGAVGLDGEVHLPDGRKEAIKTVARDEFGLLRWTDTDLSGIYRATLGQQPWEHLFAVNVPAATETQQGSESDPLRTTRTELQSTFPGWEPQIVADLQDVVRVFDLRSEAEATEVPAAGIGRRIAHGALLVALVLLLVEVVLAWRAGHHAADQAARGQLTGGRWGDRFLVALAAGVLLLGLVPLGFVFLHAAATGDFLGFLSESARAQVETRLGVPPPAPGEGSHWALDFTPYLWDAAADPWLAGGLAVLTALGVLAIYSREGRTAGRGYRTLLATLRIALVVLTLAVLLPQVQLWFEREGWPDLAIVLDDSRSMSTVDQYNEPREQEAADRFGRLQGSAPASRLALAQALLTRGEPDWLDALVTRRKLRVNVYRASSRAARLGDMAVPSEREDVAQAISDVAAEGDSSQLGTAVRQVLNDFRGSSLAAVVVLTDGITTEGEDLVKVSRYAAQRRVPLVYVGVGAAHEARDLFLHDLHVEDAVYANDRIVFEARLTGQGYADGRSVTVSLREKGKDAVLATAQVKLDPQGKPVRFRLLHQPKEPGEKTYVIDVPIQKEETKTANNKMEKIVFVRESKTIKVLYVEGYPRYEYRYIKHLLERESDRERRTRAVDLKVLLLDADEDYPAEDRTALPHFPLREELHGYDVVILGDVNPRDPKVEKHLPQLADFVRERGGGFLMIAGPRHSPQAWKDTVLRDILPIEVVGTPAPDADRPTGFRPEVTPTGRFHPLFRFSPDEAESADLWNRLPPLYWFAEGYRHKPAAEVLLVHPDRPAAGNPLGGGSAERTAGTRHPLAVQQFVGAGRSMFLGFEETWLWRKEELRFNQFWVQTIRHLARSRLGRIDVRLDKQTPYRRAEPIRVTVRFPDDAPAPGPEVDVKILLERRPFGEGEVERSTLHLHKVEGSRASYETVLTRTPEGEYRFWLSSPDVPNPKPRAEGQVLPPPGELEQLRMNQADLERSAEETNGRVYTLADADRLIDELPAGTRVTLRTPQPPLLLWNHAAVFGMALALFTLEWIMRKRKHLV